MDMVYNRHFTFICFNRCKKKTSENVVDGVLQCQRDLCWVFYPHPSSKLTCFYICKFYKVLSSCWQKHYSQPTVLSNYCKQPNQGVKVKVFYLALYPISLSTLFLPLVDMALCYGMQLSWNHRYLVILRNSPILYRS